MIQLRQAHPDPPVVSRFPFRADSEWIAWEVATLCADCDTVHNQPDGTCPRCTSKHGILLSRLLSQKRAV